MELAEHKPTDVKHLVGLHGVPDFWATCFKNNKMIQQIVKEKDAAALEYVTNIYINEDVISKQKNLTVTLFFRKNEFFTNIQLRTSVIYADPDGEEVKQTIGTDIDWKEGMNLTTKKTKKT